MNDLEILFCVPTMTGQFNVQMDAEMKAVGLLDLVAHVIRIEDVVDDGLDRLEDFLPPGHGQPLLYRGWMLLEDEYEQLYEVLVSQGYQPVTRLDQYALAHYLPNYHPLLEKMTAPAVWTWDTDLDEAWEVAHALGPPPYLLKDHVKSAKERWEDCCFIPPHASRKTFDRICTNFIAYRGDRFERGLVFRSPLPLRYLGESDHGYPMYDEYRLFFWQGKLIAAEAYHETGSEAPGLAQFRSLGRKIDSPLFSADVARLNDGSWTVIEIGDGGVTALPPLLDPVSFYEQITAPDGTEPEADDELE